MQITGTPCDNASKMTAGVLSCKLEKRKRSALDTISIALFLSTHPCQEQRSPILRLHAILFHFAVIAPCPKISMCHSMVLGSNARAFRTIGRAFLEMWSPLQASLSGTLD